MPVAELMERVSASEFVHWQAFHALEPWGAEVEDYRAGLGPAIYVNAHSEKGTPPMSPFDLYPHYRAAAERPREPTPEDTSRAIKARIFGIADEDEA